jgi:phage tail protein X
MAATQIATTLQGDTIDLLCWRELGTTSGGVVEQTMALNQNLSDNGPILPPLTDVVLPVLTAATPAPIETKNLWD